MVIEVMPYSTAWAEQFEQVAAALREALAEIPRAAVEHVGSTSVPGLAAKPIIDIDVIVAREHMPTAVSALESLGYLHLGNLGITGREALAAPDDGLARHVYVCETATLAVRNHLAVREVLRRRDDLRDEYAAVKVALAADPSMDIDAYVAGKSAVLQRILAEAGLTDSERRQIHRLNDPSA